MAPEALIPTAPSRLEAYANARRPRASRTLSASYAEPLGLPELLALADDEGRRRFESVSLGYADSEGGERLRTAIAARHPSCGADDVVTFAGAQEAIFCVFAALLSPGDHVVTYLPAYEDLEALPRRFGADVTAIPLRAERDFAPDLDEYADALRDDTKLVVLNFPHNPTGATVDGAGLRTMVDLATARGARVFSDEVYRLLAHGPDGPGPAAADLSERAISLDVRSKAFGLGGVRVGWIVTRDAEVRARALAVKTHLSLCHRAPDAALAELALGAADPILARNVGIVRRNLDLVDSLFARLGPRFEWRRPAAGCLSWPGLAVGGDAEAFADGLANEEGILLYPASLFGLPAPRFRLGLGRADLPELLPRFERYARDRAGPAEA